MTKMGQIVKRKKKGRPSKADLAKRRSVGEDASAPERELRRSHRQRNVRYTFDFDDYLDDDELFEGFDDEEDERRREKKLKLLLKLQTSRETTTTESTPSETRRASHAPAASQSSSDLAGDGSYNKPSKKRKMSDSLARGRSRQGVNEEAEAEAEVDEEDENDDVDDDDNENVEDDEVVKGGGKADEPKGVEDSAPGTPTEAPSGLPLPEKKTLELILDKLQKKDIYGVYAEPADPEELPDYHEVIEHPMDFTTARNKLGNGSYANLEQFESDVFLISSNAMQYNGPDTIYHKQARAIQELAKRKFQKIRLGIERSDELKSDQKTRLNSVVKKQIRKPISRTLQDPVGSDFSSGATLATNGDIQNGSSAAQVGGSERASSVDRLEVPPVIDNSIDKAEELLPGKRPLAKIERKQSLNDENRRATYNLSTQPVASFDSVFSTFDGESKQLVSVGLYADHSYARSLARFAATLGPVAWRIASKRIEQALPSGSKFGRGWVGEYEPLPTPVLMLENCTLKEPPFFTKIEQTVVTRKQEKMPTKPVSSRENIVTEPCVDKLVKAAPSYKDSTVQRKSAFFGSTVIKPTACSSPSISLPAKEQAVRVLEGRSFFGSANKTTFSASSGFQQQNSQPRNFTEPEKRFLKEVELNGPPSGSQTAADFVVERQILNSSDIPGSRSKDMVPKNKSLLLSGSFKQSNLNGVAVGGLPNGKVNNIDSNKKSSSASDLAKGATYFPHAQDQGLTDPVLLMKMLTEKAQNQQKSSNQSPVDSGPVLSPALPLRKEDSGNAAAAAARAWMSIGAGGFRPAGENTGLHKNQISADSLYNPARDLQSQVSRFRGDPPPYAMHLQPDKNNFPFHPFVPQPTRIGSDVQFHNQPMVYPQLVTADLSRFQVQSPWQPISPQWQPMQKQESLPPDLNVSFQSSGSPGRPASSVLVDSQQPDLALQL
ncbi:uncharacterized protein [Coffea arabica]|uniref:Bromo domain-containing protein n=1 Tax=Coffea arabica TaxID=13443 RepID=A0A6P6S6W4_COFAR|nr:uncharacterized protein LOC113687842 [Coffea arabica]